MSYTTDAARWRAVSSREASANGLFVYSVRSTGIYCRTVCPGRLARRANVSFYNNAAEAEAAGFRACKRCRPDIAQLREPSELAVAKALEIIEQVLGNEREGSRGNEERKELGLKKLAERVGLTPRYFHKIFKDRVGVTPKEYVRRKLDEAEQRKSFSEESMATTGGTMIASEVPPLDAYGFDFCDFIDFDADPGLMACDQDPAHHVAADFSGSDCEIETPPPLLLPNGFGMIGEGWGEKDVMVDFGDLQAMFDAPWTTTTSTFDTDAAFISSADMLLTADIPANMWTSA